MNCLLAVGGNIRDWPASDKTRATPCRVMMSRRLIDKDIAVGGVRSGWRRVESEQNDGRERAEHYSGIRAGENGTGPGRGLAWWQW